MGASVPGVAPLRATAGNGGAWLPPPGFAVYNRNASIAAWKRCQSALRISARDHDPGRMSGRCRRAVSGLEDPASWDAHNQSWDRKIAGRIWKQYRMAMRAAGAVDFDDLLVLPLHLMAEYPGLRARTAGRFRQLLVDEYQDTNASQYLLVKLLVGMRNQFTVVGDDDTARQSRRWQYAKVLAGSGCDDDRWYLGSRCRDSAA